jgi:hypothetical protein
MLVLRCTAKLLKELGCEPADTDDVAKAHVLNVWFANLLRLDRRKCVLFTNEKTLFSFLVPGLKREQLRSIGEVFAENLSERLAAEGLGKYEKKLVGDRSITAIAKTNSKSVLGSMNDLALQIEYHIKGCGGLETMDLKRLNREINRVPMGALGYRYAIESFEDELS